MEWNLEEAMAYYRKVGAPGDQNALVGLLKEVQQEYGGIPAHVLPAIAAHYGIKETLLQALIRRIPSLRLSDIHTLELCNGPNCSKRPALAEFVEKTYGSKPAGFTVKYVPCMRLCGKGPNIKWDGNLYHGADAELLRRLVEGK